MKNYILSIFVLSLGLNTYSQQYYPVTQGIETYLQTHLSTEEIFSDLSDMGFNRLILEPHNLHDLANSYGLDVYLANWWNIDTDPSAVENAFNTASSVENLIGINLTDEPYFNTQWNPAANLFPASYYEGVVTDYKAQYPDIKLGLTFSYGPWYDVNLDAVRDHFNPGQFVSYREVFLPYYELVDIVRLTPYTYLVNAPPAEVVNVVSRSRALATEVEQDIDFTVILQAWSVSDDTPNPDLPPIEELRAQSYATVLSGVDAISYFTYNPEVFDKVPGFTQGFEDMIGEIATFTQDFEDFNVDSWLDNSGTYLSSHIVSKSLPRQDFCALINLSNTTVSEANLDPYEVRIVEGAFLCPFELPADSSLVFTATDEVLSPENDIQIYPNPSNEEVVYIESVSAFENAKNLSVKITNVNGQVLQQFPVIESTTKLELNVSNYPAGIYFVQLNTKNSSASKRFVIER